MTLLFKSLPLTRFKELTEGDPEGTIEAIVSVFNNVDSMGEVVMPGAFQKSLAKKLPRFVWSHNWELPIGKVVQAMELLPGDPRLPPDLMSLGGLYVKAKFNLETTRGRDAYADLKFGAIDEFSIGYRVLRAHRVTEEGEEEDDTDGFGFFRFGGKSTRYLDELDLLECSPVLAGANNRTALIGVKADQASIAVLVDAAEEALREALIGAKVLSERRQKEGRTFSAPNYAKLEGLANRLEEMSAELRSLLESSKPKSGESDNDKDDPKPDEETEPSLIQEVDRSKGLKAAAEYELTRMRLLQLNIPVHTN